MSFIIDTTGDKELLSDNYNVKLHKISQPLLNIKPKEKTTPLLTQESLNVTTGKDTHEDEEEDYFGLPPPSVDISNIIRESLNAQAVKLKKDKSQLELEYVTEKVNALSNKTIASKRPKRQKVIDLDHSNFNPLTKSYDGDEELRKLNMTEVLSNSQMPVGLEKIKGLPIISKEKQAKLNRLERAKTKGAGWFNMPATEITEELQNDLKILQMRSALNPKKFYKKNDLKVLPKYFQVGIVQHSPLDYYNERDTRRNKKKSIVDELLADAQLQQYTKRKYKEVMARRDYYARRKAMKKLKKLKK